MKGKQIITIVAYLVLMHMIIDVSSKVIRATTSLDADANSEADHAPVNAEELLCNRTRPNYHRWCKIYCMVEGYSVGVCIRHECRCIQ